MNLTRPLIYLCTALALFCGCATNPVTKKKEFAIISEQQEIAIGQEQYLYGQQSQGGELITDPALTAYVQGIGNKLAAVSDRPELPYEFVILNNGVPNAWAMPGGKIAINRGLLTELKSEAELAAVLAHEIVHAAARHGAKSLERGIALQGLVIATAVGLEANDVDGAALYAMGAGLAAQLVNLKYGRHAELESDAYGMKYMTEAGYDPMAAAALQETLLHLSKGNDPGWLGGLLASHPPSRERMDRNREWANNHGKGGFIGEEVYQQKIAGLLRTKSAYKNYDEGLKALKQKNTAGVMALANSAQKIEPHEALFYGLAAKGYSQQKRYDDALRALDRAIQLNPEYFDFYLHKGQIMEKKGQKQAANALYKKSFSLLPTKIAETGLQNTGAGRN